MKPLKLSLFIAFVLLSIASIVTVFHHGWIINKDLKQEKREMNQTSAQGEQASLPTTTSN